MKSIIYGTLSCISLILLSGTAGASDRGVISTEQAITQTIFFMVVFVVFASLTMLSNEPHNIQLSKQDARRNIFLSIQNNLKLSPEGYTVFNEEKAKGYYSVTFLSTDKKHCVLATCEDIDNPKALATIISFDIQSLED